MFGWLVNRQFFTLAFLVAVLFFFKYKKHYIAIYFWKNNFYTYYKLRHFGSLDIWDITDSWTFFFFFPGRPVNVKWECFRWSSITTNDVTINYFHCIIIVSQSSSLFILRSEGDWCVLALNISNIGLGFMEIMQLTCVASWLASFLYIQVLLGIFQMNI